MSRKEKLVEVLKQIQARTMNFNQALEKIDAIVQEDKGRIMKQPVVMYSKNFPKGKTFDHADEVPEGFVDSPAKIEDIPEPEEDEEKKRPGRSKKG